MIYPQTFERLYIGPAGPPADTPEDSRTLEAIDQCVKHGWDTMEVAFVYQVHIGEKEAEKVAAHSKKLSFPLSAHGSYYINLAAKEPKKIGASRSRIVQAAVRIAQAGGHSVVFHSAFLMGRDSSAVTALVIEQLKKVEEELKAKGTKVWLRPELTGKPTQHGDVEELIKVCNKVETALPCIDWAHLYARTGGQFNSYEEWCAVLDRLARGIKNKNVLERMHMHLSGIEFGPRGEKRHIPLSTCELRYKELMQALKQAGVAGTLIVEAPEVCQLEDVDRIRTAWAGA